MREKILGRYELTSRLGRGGMGEVWAAHDHSLDRQIALKFLAPTGQQSTPAVLEERFRREARYTARLRHSGVPEIHDVGKLPDGRLYLVMELIEGRTLTDLLASQAGCPVHQALSIAGQIAAVLAHAHRYGLVHRDLKPSNLMLTTSGRVKVLDFGIAAALTPTPDEPRLTGAGGGVVGTPGFISPEQAVGKPATDRSDLYALGCVLYEILTGQPPFTADTPVAVAYQHVYEQPRPVAELRPEIPAELADLVMRLLAKEPAGRLSTEETVAAVEALVAEADAGAGRATVVLPQQSDPDNRVRSASLSQTTPTMIGPSHSTAHAAVVALRGRLSSLDEIEALFNECEDLFLAEDYSRACEGYRSLTEMLSSTPNVTDRMRFCVRSLYASCLAKLGRTTEALAEYKELIAHPLWAGRPTDPVTLEAHHKFALLLGQCGHYREAYVEANLLRNILQNHRPDDPKIAAIDVFLARLVRLQATARHPQQPTV